MANCSFRTRNRESLFGPAVPSVEQQAVIRHSVGPALPSAERLLGAGFTPQSNERCPTAVSGPVTVWAQPCPQRTKVPNGSCKTPSRQTRARPCLQWNEQRPTAVSRPGTHKVAKSLGPALPSAKRGGQRQFQDPQHRPLGPGFAISGAKSGQCSFRTRNR